jgi:predicted nuclease of restriction endonuclease-like (RecB) superfamily
MALPTQADFNAVLGLIEAARTRAVAAVNTSLIDLYWSIGQYISRRVAEEDWGQGTIEALAETIRRRYPAMTGYSASNLWRMKQFFETYRDQPKLATLLRELSWSHNLAIMSRSKRDEEREFYLRMAVRERWSFRELQRQLAGALFERTALSPAKLSPVVRELYPDAATIFKDSYLVEFLDLPPGHTEADLQRALVEKLKAFLIELGRDFCFVGSQYPLQVGGRDFALDLLFFNRALNCLVAFELKIEEFQPEHLGKLEFYLEALDRDVKKPHERPSIGPERLRGLPPYVAQSSQNAADTSRRTVKSAPQPPQQGRYCCGVPSDAGGAKSGLLLGYHVNRACPSTVHMAGAEGRCSNQVSSSSR